VKQCVFVLLVGNYKDDTVFVSNREKLEKSFEAFSQVLDNFVAKVHYLLLVPFIFDSRVVLKLVLLLFFHFFALLDHNKYKCFF